MTVTWWNKLKQKISSIMTGSKSAAIQKERPSGMNIEMRFDLTREPKPNLGLPPNAIPGLSVIKQLVRGLRYRAILEPIGQEVNLTSIEKAPEEICSIIHQYGISIESAPRDYSSDAFLKYGILDYQFEVSGDFSVEPQGVRFLKDLGFLLDKKDVDDSLFLDAGIGVLEEMLDQVKSNKVFFKILLDSQGGYRGGHISGNKNWLSANPNEYFPCKFKVRDACLTNCSLVWLNKHFYL
ncbi:MAG: hypothetical protein IPG59_08695 [Candidatus Melainabacteria bacterium]|nr:MAG: hypothetical protein IPG59_08695 [Candidatus Melainabacteria bacterium]